MGNRVVLGVIVLAAVVGVFFLLGGTEFFSGLSDRGEGGGGTESAGLDGADEAADSSGAKGADHAKGPVLFGRARALRQGLGGLQGRVMDFQLGEPVEGAAITLVGEGYGSEPVSQRALTDPSGFFAFAEIAAGDGYALRVSDSKGRQHGLPSQSIDRGGLTDVGTVWLGKRGTLTGRVIDEDGAPVGHADVQVHPGGASVLELFTNMGNLLEQLDKDAEPIASGESKADGTFAIEDLAPGPLTLVVRAAGFQQKTDGIVMASEGAAGGDLEVRMRSARAVVGVVVNHLDRPVAGARVACLDKSEMTSVFYARQFTETDADGRFRVPSPPSEGSFAVIVTAAEYPTLFAESSGEGEQRFVLQGGTGVVLRIVEAGTSRGVPDAHLMAMFSTEATMQSKDGVSFATGVTDARGEATFLARPGHLVMLYFNHAERGTSMYSPMMAAMAGGVGKGMLVGPKDVVIGKRRETFEFEISTGITITGHVTDDEGEALAGVRCGAMGIMGFGSMATTDAEGYYELKNQSPPVRFVMATKSGYVQDLDMKSLAGGMKSEDGVIDITLKRAASVSGRVVDVKGAPVAGARVRAASKSALAMLSAMTGGTSESITNSDGRYVVDGVSPGKKVRVKVRHAKYIDAQTAEFPVAAAGATMAPELVVRQGTVLTITVETPDGRRARGAKVEVDVDAEEEVEFDPMGSFQSFADVRTREGGSVQVPKLPPGEVTVTSRYEDHAPGRAKLTLEARGGAAPNAETKREIVVRLRRGVSLKVRVLDAGGAPLEGASVSVRSANPAAADTDEDWVARDSGTAGKDGRLTFKGLPGVQVHLDVSHEGHVAAKQVVGAGLGEVVFRLENQDPDAAARIEAIDKELMELYTAIGAAKDDDERREISQRIQALNAEKAKLSGD